MTIKKRPIKIDKREAASRQKTIRGVPDPKPKNFLEPANKAGIDISSMTEEETASTGYMPPWPGGKTPQII